MDGEHPRRRAVSCWQSHSPVVIAPNSIFRSTPRGAGGILSLPVNNGIWHNIQLQAVRQSDPKKIIQQKRKA